MTTKINQSTKQFTAVKLLLTALHLFCYWLFGTLTLGIFITLFFLSLLLTGLGVGFFIVSLLSALLLGAGYIIFSLLTALMLRVARFEQYRAASLYDLQVSKINPVRPVTVADGSTRRSLLIRYSKSKLQQFVEPQMWRALSSFLLNTLFGLFMIASLQFGILAVVRAIDEITATNGSALLAITTALFALFLLLLAPALVFASVWVTTKLFTTPSRASLTAAIASSKEQHSGAVRAASVERTRIERDLHDGVQPRLVSIGMNLGLAKQKLNSDPAAASELINDAHTSVKTAITELRQLARGIHAAVLTDRGLDAALSALASNSHIPVRLNTQLTALDSLPAQRRGELEAAVYFIVAEALTNVAKHSRATACSVSVTVESAETSSAGSQHTAATGPGATAGGSTQMIVAAVIDNGVGGAQNNPGGGIDGISQRAIAAGGTARLTSPAGGPTILEVRIPCES